MKKLLYLIFLTTTLGTRAQTSIYHPFPDSNAVWNWQYYASYCTPFSQVDEEYSYELDGDTVIGSMQYHKIVIPFVQVNNTLCGPRNDIGYRGFIRQSIIDKKVFCILPNDSVEQLIFDFNLQVGDSIPALEEDQGGQCYEKIIVTQIDSVLIGASYRKRWNGSGLIIIEGIGSNWEFLHPLCEIIDGATGVLTCFKQNGTSLYPNTSYNCNLITSLYSISSNHSSANLFPNPFHTSITVETQVEKSTMKIYNSLGVLVREEGISYYSTVFNRNSLSDGIYFYRLSNEKGEIASGKFVID